jgi:hypothetical protein
MMALKKAMIAVWRFLKSWSNKAGIPPSGSAVQGI